MAFTQSWVESDPDGSVITVAQLDDSDRLIKAAVRERLEGDTAAPNLTGLIEVGSFAAAPKPRKGAARVYVDTDVNIAAFGATVREDGRLAVSSDGKRLYHVATAAVVEIDYLCKTTGGTVAGATTFSAALTVTGGYVDIQRVASDPYITFTRTGAGAQTGYWQLTTGKILTTDCGVAAATFSGALTGNVTGNCSGNAGTVTGLSVTPGQTLTVTTGGTLGSAAYTASTAYDVAGAAAAVTPTSLGLVIGVNVQAYNSNLTAINQALTTTSSPSFTAVTTNVTGNCSGSSGSCTGNAATVTGLAVTAGQTLTVTTGGTLGSAAYTAATAYATSGHNHAGVYDPAGSAAAVTPTSLGLVIGTNVQAYNSNLTAINQALTSTSSPSFTVVTTNITGNCSGSSSSCTGLAATATALATPRAINGVNFDGTAPVTVTAAAGTLTGTTLNATVVTSSLTSVGTLGVLAVTGAVTIGGAAITPNAGKLGVAVTWECNANAGGNTSPFRLPGTNDVTSPVDGDIWITGGALKVRLGGVTKTVTVT